MDARRRAVEFEHADELERLRRRAYGPDADIAGDAAAQARLSELEVAHRAQAIPVDDATAAVPGAPVPGATPERVPVAEGVEPPTVAPSLPLPGGMSAAQTRPEASTTEQNPAPASSAVLDAIHPARALAWWRRRRWLALGGIAAVLALNAAVTASTWQLLGDRPVSAPSQTPTPEIPRVPAGGGGGTYVPAPDYVLALRSDGAADDQPKDPGGKLDALGISLGELRRYENFRGPEAWNINVWSGESRFGMTCLLIAVANQPISDGGRAAEGCSLRGHDTIADIGGDRSLTRLVLRGDHIDVYVYEGGADPNAS